MSQWVQRADSVKESPSGGYMSESTASAMQTHTVALKPESFRAGEEYRVELVNL